MRATVVGAGGLLGSHLCAELRAAGHQVDALDRGMFDLSSPDRELLYRLRDRLTALDTHVVFNTAAYTNVDGAEKDTELAFRVNALGAELVARAADEAGTQVCHISTDFVFRGDQDRPYDEFDPIGPQSEYARSKAAGEALVLRAARRSFVVRVGGLYGQGGRNFFSTMLDRLRRGQALSVDRQRRVTPTWVRALSRQLIALCERGEYGVYHATCAGETTWFEFAQELYTEAKKRGADLPDPPTFQGVPSSALVTPAPRPAMSVLDCRMLRARGLYQMPSWRDALHGYLDEVLPLTT